MTGLDRSAMSFGCDEDIDGSETLECWKLCCEDVGGVDGSVFVNGSRIGGISGRLIFLFLGAGISSCMYLLGDHLVREASKSVESKSPFRRNLSVFL